MDKATLDALINKGSVTQTELYVDDKGTLSDNIKDLSDKEFAEQYTTQVGITVGSFDPTKPDSTPVAPPTTTTPSTSDTDDKKKDDVSKAKETSKSTSKTKTTKSASKTIKDNILVSPKSEDK